jgi:hypothetical protein
MTACSQDDNRTNGRFPKGRSGNPGGRPLRRLTTDAIEALVAVLEERKSPAAARVAAANALLDRGWGRPAQMILTLEQELQCEQPATVEAAGRIAAILDAARVRKQALQAEE